MINIGTQFILAGNAVFTVSNPQGVRYTYKVREKEGRKDGLPIYFISLLTGPENTRDYTYMGVIKPEDGDIRLTKASKYKPDSLPYKVAKWACKVIWEALTVPSGYDIQHAGRCGRCGRTLTVPESIQNGFGPECIGLIGG